MPDRLFELDRWIARFALDDVRSADPSEISGQIITSPFHLAVVEQIRRERARDACLGPTVPADVFVFAKGESPVRHYTKIGGLPYRPKGIPWPTTRDNNQPMTFVGQLNFVNSLDICGPVPGHVLLVFARDDAPLLNDPDAFRFEWYEEGLTDLVESDGVPPPAWRFVVCYGQACRTCDYPEGEEAFSQYDDEWQLAILEGTKIGGVPAFQMEIDEYGGAPGKFLASIGSVQAVYNRPYPWINEPSPVILDYARGIKLSFREDQELMWGDAGVVNLFLNERGEVCWTLHCY
ncbi:MAG: DUF1963 domain-containing protein [Pirellulales bacterium]